MTDQERAMGQEAMDNMTVFEARMLAVEGFRTCIGNGHLFAIIPDDKEHTEKWEALRVENGY